MDKQDERVRFLAKLPPDLHRWLKVTAAERGTDMNALLIAALEITRRPQVIAQAITASLAGAAIADWETEPGAGKTLELHISQIAPIAARVIAEGTMP